MPRKLATESTVADELEHLSSDRVLVDFRRHHEGWKIPTRQALDMPRCAANTYFSAIFSTAAYGNWLAASARQHRGQQVQC
jgi:hypothetical protein